MTLPVINAVINFSTGPSFAQAMILDTGILDTNVLADSAAVIVDVSNVVDTIQTNRGRNAQADQFQTGTLTMRIVDQLGQFNPQNSAGPYFGLLDPMRKVQITATYASTTYPIFSGFITSYTTTTPKNADEVTAPNINLVFSSPNTKSCHWPQIVPVGDLPFTAVLYTKLPLPGSLP